MASFYVPERTRIDQGRLFLHSALAGLWGFLQLPQGLQQRFCLWFPAFFQRANTDIVSKDAGFAGFGQIAEAMPHQGILGSHSISVQVSGLSLHRFYAIQAEKMRA